MQESRTDLKSDAEYEQDKTEVLHECQDMRVAPEAEVAEENADKEDPCGADGNSLELEFAQIKAEGDYHSKEKDGMRDTGSQE